MAEKINGDGLTGEHRNAIAGDDDVLTVGHFLRKQHGRFRADLGDFNQVDIAVGVKPSLQTVEAYRVTRMHQNIEAYRAAMFCNRPADFKATHVRGHHHTAFTGGGIFV